MKKYSITASAIGSYYHIGVEANSEEEAIELALAAAPDEWEYNFGDPEMDLDDVAAEEK